jgi:hypothetical protein
VFAIDASSFLVSAAFLTALRVETHVRPKAQRFWHDVGDGWHEVRRHHWLTAGFLGFALGNVGIGLYLVLGPIVSRQHLGGAQAWGLILALQQEVRPDRLARVSSFDWLLSLCLMPAGQALAGPLSNALGVRTTLVLAGALMCVPNLCVLAFVREVRTLRRQDAPSPAPVT